MGNMTLAIPDKIQKEMGKHPEIRWSNVARQAIEEKMNKLELMDKILENSQLTEKDAEEIGDKIKEEIMKKYEKRFGKWK